jgi:dephospho-CoA kinase
VPLIALTGGIAAGKSTVAERLAELGAVIVDADQVVRDVQGPGSPVLQRIVAEFGDGILSADGSLNRAALGSLVFGHPDRLAALNAIVHPAVREESARRFGQAFSADADAVVVYDVPLLVEARVDDPWELIVVAHAPAEVRERRLRELRGMSAQEAASRIASQVPDEARLGIADVVIDTAGTLAQTRDQVDVLWEALPLRIAARRSR